MGLWLGTGCTRSTVSVSDTNAAVPTPQASAHDPTEENAAESAPAAARPARRGSWTTLERTTLVAIEHQHDSPTAETSMIRVEGGLHDPGPPKRWSALRPSEQPAYRFIAAHGGRGTYVVVQPDADRYALQWASAGPSDPAAPVDLGTEVPAAMIMHGKTVVLGIGTKLVEVSLDDPRPQASIVHQRAASGTKAYDLFASAGDWLVAIDDMGMPYYADSLRLDALGRVDHEVGFALPTLINGFYRAAALHRSGADEGQLFVLVHYGVIDGYGQMIAGLQMHAGATVHGADFTLNEAMGKHGIDEFTDRASDAPVLLATGATMTDWSGMDVLAHDGPGPSVLVAAQARGLLVFRAPLEPKNAAVTVLDLGAPCHDVLVDGTMVYALLEGEVVALQTQRSRTAVSLVERERISLSGRPTRWAR